MSAKRVREGAATPTPATVYIESSALVSAWLESDGAAKRALDEPGRRIASTITFAEARRAVVRARVAGRISAAQESAILLGIMRQAALCQLVAVSDDVLARVGQPFPVEPVRTLDAIHLATLELLRPSPSSIRVATRDARVAANARAMGLEVV